jgi:hypothetical protein
VDARPVAFAGSARKVTAAHGFRRAPPDGTRMLLRKVGYPASSLLRGVRWASAHIRVGDQRVCIVEEVSRHQLVGSHSVCM